ncbi:hypothetical protein DACRYDRAFT_22821 [Dacryopinax primogenitus]|uniref:Maintenance of telomere capping protein 1 n=1 Tax=Dacryopinax primogenitus (strain DJM 731) TaxID=1858805 RepID=M5FTL0_DACPD|nr:uncharacterized protein DACRYDRAFT_22821 [Dacryopinax primogenitus]EJU00986.1 hypothetical protein DACRYDRAFT_22821 [Dacryopinax primogenitus]
MAASKPTSKAEEALQFLDDLDSFTPAAAPATTGGPTEPTTASTLPPPGEAAEVLAFLDEITQKSSETPKSTASIIAASTSRPPSATPGAAAATPSAANPNRVSPIPSARQQAIEMSAAEASEHHRTPSQTGGWGWGGVGGLWSTASSALQQARSVAEEQAKQLQSNEQAKKWTEGVMGYVKNANLDKLSQDLRTAGISTFNEILNAVAPPIAEHEVIQVWLSHDMHGYEGVESLVYRSLTKIMEQVEGGDLVVNKGNESKPRNTPAYEGERDLNAVEGYEQALKLAQANLEDMIKSHADKPTSSRAVSQHNPTTYSSVFLRIQPYFVDLSLDPGATSDNAPRKRQLQFLLHLSDPTHTLLHTQITQGVPAEWLMIWDDNEWVEDMVVEAIRLGIEVIGQEYVVARMGWMRKGEQPAKPEEETEKKA